METWLIALMLTLIFLCSMGEAILISTNRSRLRLLLHPSRQRNHAEIWRFLDQRENLTSLVTGFTALVLIVSALTTHSIESVKPGWSEVIGLGMALIIVSLAEVLPKSIGVMWAEILLVRGFKLWRLLVSLFYPLSVFVYAVAKATLNCFGVYRNIRSELTKEEVMDWLSLGVESKVIEPEEHFFAKRILKLDETFAKEIMVARSELVALPSKCSLDEVMETVLKTGHSRIPIYDGNLDNIVGVVYAYDILSLISDGNYPLPADIARPPYFTSENKLVRELLQEMRSKQIQVAIVLDERGLVSGLITLEDIVEEIVGELLDEHDREGELIAQLDDHAFISDAKISS